MLYVHTDEVRKTTSSLFCSPVLKDVSATTMQWKILNGKRKPCGSSPLLVLPCILNSCAHVHAASGFHAVLFLSPWLREVQNWFQQWAPLCVAVLMATTRQTDGEKKVWPPCELEFVWISTHLGVSGFGRQFRNKLIPVEPQTQGILTWSPNWLSRPSKCLVQISGFLLMLQCCEITSNCWRMFDRIPDCFLRKLFRTWLINLTSQNILNHYAPFFLCVCCSNMRKQPVNRHANKLTEALQWWLGFDWSLSTYPYSLVWPCVPVLPKKAFGWTRSPIVTMHGAVIILPWRKAKVQVPAFTSPSAYTV